MRFRKMFFTLNRMGELLFDIGANDHSPLHDFMNITNLINFVKWVEICFYSAVTLPLF